MPPDPIPAGPIPATQVPLKGGGKQGLGKKIGPLPAWAWGVVIIGMVAFVVLIRKKTASPGGVDTGPNRIYNIGGGPPQNPPIGVVLDPKYPTFTNGVPMCPIGMEPVGGLCVPIGTTDPPTPDPSYRPPPDPSVRRPTLGTGIHEIPIHRRRPPLPDLAGMEQAY